MRLEFNPINYFYTEQHSIPTAKIKEIRLESGENYLYLDSHEKAIEVNKKPFQKKSEEAVPIDSVALVRRLKGLSYLQPQIAKDSLEQEKLQRAIQMFMDCSESRKLYEEAYLTPTTKIKKGHWTIKIVSPGSVFHFDAICHQGLREIHIRTGCSEKYILAALIFELTNASHIPKFRKLDREAEKGNVSCLSYVKQKEKIEHSGALRHRRIVQIGIDDHLWGNSVDIFTWVPPNFENAWNKISLEHINCYKNWWQIQYQKKYEAAQER